MLEVCQKESNSCNSAVAALTSELLVNIAVAEIKNGVLKFSSVFSLLVLATEPYYKMKKERGGGYEQKIPK